MLPELAAPSLPPSIPSSEPSDVPSSNKWTGKSREGSKHNREKRTICGIELPILILSCAVVILSAALAVTGTLLGLKLSSLEENVQAIMSINSTNRSSQAPPSQNNSENHTNSTNSTTILYTSYTNTSTEYPLPLEYLKVPGWTYLGCYFDSANRVLPEVVLRDNTKMTNKVCGRTCAQEGYNMFGTENKGECWCGNENIDNATKRQRAPDWTCDMMCGGAADGYEPCGGFWTISLWGKNVSS
ncbi:WSC domain-containing protein [Podospora fimiseda]|uniref:WSC domain-containing protein n=1 Tax=Podospora fimiseda TaxID=252190 RepID=A0AAN7BPZ9_9PEZI|nr:WSC domain-containing protein [Podospora fimiseda]